MRRKYSEFRSQESGVTSRELAAKGRKGHRVSARSAFSCGCRNYSLASPITKYQSPITNCSSFTLVELLVVIVIIGMLAGLGLSAMHHIGRATALQSAARQFANDVNMARNYAVSNSKYVYL